MYRVPDQRLPVTEALQRNKNRFNQLVRTSKGWKKPKTSEEEGSVLCSYPSL